MQFLFLVLVNRDTVLPAGLWRQPALVFCTVPWGPHSLANQLFLPGLLKLKLRKRPAVKAGTRPNPFKPGEMMAVKARPASNVVKALPLKSLKEYVK